MLLDELEGQLSRRVFHGLFHVVARELFPVNRRVVDYILFKKHITRSLERILQNGRQGFVRVRILRHVQSLVTIRKFLN